jgi:type IV secretory pathway VirB4 component
MAEQPTLPTQSFVDIKEIRDGVVYLKKGGLRRVLIVSGVNFDLKSEAEQGLILGSFQNFLNTLDFSVQFFIHSRKVNVDAYLESMRARATEEQNQLLKVQIEEYVEFIRSFVEENAIIAKTFFVVVPYETAAVVESAKGILGLFGKKPAAGAKEKSVQETLEQLEHRVNQVIDGLEQIGLRAAPLGNDELVELFYNLYNPQLVEKRGVEITRAA